MTTLFPVFVKNRLSSPVSCVIICKGRDIVWWLRERGSFSEHFISLLFFCRTDGISVRTVLKLRTFGFWRTKTRRHTNWRQRAWMLSVFSRDVKFAMCSVSVKLYASYPSCVQPVTQLCSIFRIGQWKHKIKINVNSAVPTRHLYHALIFTKWIDIIHGCARRRGLERIMYFYTSQYTVKIVLYFDPGSAVCITDTVSWIKSLWGTATHRNLKNWFQYPE